MSNLVKQSLLCLATLASALLFSPLSLASGTIGPSASGIQAPQRNIDPRYEYGKAVFLGREPGVEKLAYCLPSDSKPKKLKRRAVKAYRGGTISDFAKAIIKCDQPSELALTSLKPEQARLVLYYLNKRYKLKLTDG